MGCNDLWKLLTKDEKQYVQRGFEAGEEESSLLVSKVPLAYICFNARSIEGAQENILHGEPSKTKGPIHLRYDPEKDSFFIIDGHHRFANAVRKKQKTIDVRIMGSGYNDYYRTGTSFLNR